MSALDQVYSDYYHYVCAYIVAKSGYPASAVIRALQSREITFSLYDPGEGDIMIANWCVPTVPQPSTIDLMALSPGSAVDFMAQAKHYSNFYTIKICAA
jgi:hypothetical protein